MTLQDAKVRRTAPLRTPSNLSSNSVSLISAALTEMLADMFALYLKTKSGHIVGDSFADYLIPVHADMPEFDIAMIEEEDLQLPSGVKGIGMLGTAGIQAAIANAVYHATGKRVRSLPIRIESIID
jgi:CO/xanthine dehydrogenase Mo-binding subunit